MVSDADPAGATRALERIAAGHGIGDRLASDAALESALAAVTAASPWLTRILVTDPLAVEIAARPDGPLPEVPDAAPESRLRRVKALGLLRVAVRDLLGLDDLEQVGRGLADLAGRLLEEAYAGARAARGMAVIAMGKLGGAELNYASDVDLLLVAPDGDGTGPAPAVRPPESPGALQFDPRPFVHLARSAWRIDLDLRPEGRSGALARSLTSYEAYWSRWAAAWEFQALLKARPVAGDPELGARFAAAAGHRVWGRALGAEDLRELRRMKARAEGEVLRRGRAELELKRGPGGIRDIEFAAQLLQLVHGPADPELRQASTLAAVRALAAGGYIAGDDAAALDSAYRFLRTVEHRLQLYEGLPSYTLPSSRDRLAHLARVMGYRPEAARGVEEQMLGDLRRHRATARTIHERLFFRPLLEAFGARRPDRSAPGGSGVPATSGTPGAIPVVEAGALPAEAVVARLTAFGFTDAARTRQAVAELTRGFSRISQLMQQILPLLLDWLSDSADPDQGLLGLRTLAGEPHSRERLTAVCRESPTGAQQLCRLLGTGPRFARDLQRQPDALAGLASGSFPSRLDRRQLDDRLARSLAWRSGAGALEMGLRTFVQAERLRIAARDVLGFDDTAETGRALTDLADSVVAAVLARVQPAVPMAVIGMGRFGGGELGYGSDLDLLIVYEGPDAGPAAARAAALAEESASAFVRILAGTTPATGVYPVDLTLRPEGRQGPPARSLEAYATYYDRWAQPWERQALLRGRVVAGNPGVGERFGRLAGEFLWGGPFGAADVREIRRSKARMERERVPAGEDPKYHLKLGPGSLSDVEWTVQLLQLMHGVRATGTGDALAALQAAGHLDPADGAVLGEAYRFCERTRNRLSLVRDLPGDSLPTTGPVLSALARSLGFSATGLRNEYTRLTRRSRRAVERLFYGTEG